MKIIAYILGIIILSVAGYFGYDYYMTKIPVAVKIFDYQRRMIYPETEVSAGAEVYPFSEISGLGYRKLRLKNGGQSIRYHNFRLLYRKGGIENVTADDYFDYSQAEEYILPHLTD